MVKERDISSVRLTGRSFTASATCYEYEAKKNAESKRISDRLLRLTDSHRNWGVWSLFSLLAKLQGL